MHEHPSAPSALIEREARLRAEHGEQNVVMPGESTEFVEKFLRKNRPTEVKAADAALAGGNR